MSIRWGPKGRSGVISVCLSGLVVWLLVAMSGCCEECPPEVVEHDVYIKRVGDRCQISGKDESSKINVFPGDFVVWHNQMDRDVILRFPREGRLFGVLQAIAHGEGDPVKLRVLPDANPGSFPFDADCGTIMPPPEIIISPPN